MNFKNLLLALPVLLFSIQSFASWDIGYFPDRSPYAWSSVYKSFDNGETVTAHLRIMQNGAPLLYIITKTPCAFEESRNTIVQVNNQKIHATERCLGDNYFTVPATDAGRAFILQELKSQTSVNIAGFTFNAVGFTKTYNKVKSGDTGVL
ncbi:hypothetical protein BCT86_14430 [Vibrio breoganii]|uniref:hypothetical protein n=1 Tax=Vibrio breoganii TaxID=553239 RepID=UPI000C84EB05|nr:hypothetical protein [Vibrio breoganii]PML04918.1 hypothetical protein BCT86_14430 [Vibrio breoganii]